MKASLKAISSALESETFFAMPHRQDWSERFGKWWTSIGSVENDAIIAYNVLVYKILHLFYVATVLILIELKVVKILI